MAATMNTNKTDYIHLNCNHRNNILLFTWIASNTVRGETFTQIAKLTNIKEYPIIMLNQF